MPAMDLSAISGQSGHSTPAAFRSESHLVALQYLPGVIQLNWFVCPLRNAVLE